MDVFCISTNSKKTVYRVLTVSLYSVKQTVFHTSINSKLILIVPLVQTKPEKNDQGHLN